MSDQDVHFRLEAIAPSLDVGGPDGSFIGFTIGDVNVLLAHTADEADNTADDSRIIVEATRPTDDQLVEQLVRRENYLASKEPGGGRSSLGLDREQIEWMFNPPGELVAHLTLIGAEMRAAATRLVQTLRWVLHKTETVQPLIREQVLWSRDTTTWYAAPPNLQERAGFVGNVDRHTLTPGSSADVVQRLLDDAEFSEPLARQVLLEAGALVQGNPRAACVLAVVAAEVGMKQFVARISQPSETWLITEVPSPPLPKMMTDYFQHLLSSRDIEREPFSIPKRLRKTLQDAIEWRNHIVHRGVDPPDSEQIEELLSVVDEFLYTLDWAAGHEWAAAYLPAELRPHPTN